MKTLIIALNSKYIHSSLAPWYLKESCGTGTGEVKIMEFTINDSLESILAAIYREKADVAAFSCYIWNIAHVLATVQNLKKVSPGVKVILGGPEVSFDAKEVLEQNPGVDYIISGEGELAFKQLVSYLFKGSGEIKAIHGLSYRLEDGGINSSPCRLIKELDLLASPYTDEMLKTTASKIVYFESSRGCPFSCSYCISSTFEGVRYFSMERVKRDLSKLINAGIPLVKFVDRTFNCNRSRAKEILEFILQTSTGTSFHFEAAADLFDEEMIQILSRAPEGLIQLEIGVQTANGDTILAIGRKTDLDSIFHNVRILRETGNIHLHLDLIAGLPLEGLESFRKSFNTIYAMKPHQLQLGFLKMLKGSRIRKEAEVHGYVFRGQPPYEVLYNKYITFDEMLELKGVEEIVERYYNSGKFVSTLEYLIQSCYRNPFDFFYSFYKFCFNEGYLKRPLSSRELYTVLHAYLADVLEYEKLSIASNLQKLDFLSYDNSANLPEGLKRDVNKSFKDDCFNFLKYEANIFEYLTEFKGLPAKQIFKKVHFEVFDYDVTKPDKEKGFTKGKTVVLFNYARKNKVSGLYHYSCVNLMRNTNPI